MYKMFEFSCKGTDCPKHDTVIERLVDPQTMDFEECDECSRKLHQVISAPKGYVRGTINPVKYR